MESIGYHNLFHLEPSNYNIVNLLFLINSYIVKIDIGYFLFLTGSDSESHNIDCHNLFKSF